jgi:iron complex outermembrane receptor protein
LLALAGPSVWAQAAGAAAAEVITVSAQRRTEELQKVPLAVTAVSAIELEAKQIRRLDDLRMEVPNVIIEPATGTSSAAKVFMRGVGTDESLFTADPSVAIYIDDTYIARATGALFDVFDLQRVEVLRGPQGTLYGRNATGGAVRYITKKPNGEPRLQADARIGNLGRLDVQLSGGGRLGEAVAVSFGVMSKTRDGYLQDITNNRKVNDEDVKGARLGLAFDLSASTSARVSLDKLRQRSGPQYASGVLDPAKAAQYNRPVNNADGNLLTIETNLTAGKNDLDQTGLSVSTATDLGNVEWRNILSSRRMSNLLYIDLDGTAQTRFHLLQDQTQKQTSFESQLVSTGKGALSWTGGVFLFTETNTQPTRQDIFAVGGVNTVGQKTTATALYGQADWRFDPVWKATGGLRYSRESKNFSIDAIRADGTPNFNFQKKDSWTRWDWKLGVDAQLSASTLAYGSATTGFKSGGFNGRAGSVAQAGIVLKPETVLTYELGAKTSWADGAVRLNGNLFRNNYKDLQLTAFDANGVSNLINATSATIQGLELDLAAQLTRAWNVSLNLGTLDAEYKGYSAANAATFSGKQLKQAPKLQYGIGTGYRAGVAGGTLQLNAQLKHVGDHYQNLANSELIKTKAYTVADVRAAFEPAGTAWSAGLWVKNLGNKQYYTGAFDIAGIGIASAYINVPRTYGVDLRYRFW